MILDDVFAELDERRRIRLAGRVGRYEQVIVTAAVEADIPPALAGRVTRIRAGEVVGDGAGVTGGSKRAGRPARDEGQRVWARLRAVFGAPRAPGAAGAEGREHAVREGAGPAVRLEGARRGDRLARLAHPAGADRPRRGVAVDRRRETAKHATVEGFADGVLLVRCDSTAWATQLVADAVADRRPDRRGLPRRRRRLPALPRAEHPELEPRPRSGSRAGPERHLRLTRGRIRSPRGIPSRQTGRIGSDSADGCRAVDSGTDDRSTDQ